MKKCILLVMLFVASFCGYANVTYNTIAPTVTTICPNSTSNIIGHFTLSYTVGGPNTLSQITFTSTGTYVASDIVNFKLWRSTGPTFASASVVSTLTTGLGTGLHAFTGLAYTLPAASYYWITADVATYAVFNHTICDAGFGTANIFVTGASISGTTIADVNLTIGGGTMTVTATPTPMCGTGVLTLNVVTSGTAPSWSGPSFTGTGATLGLPFSAGAAGVYTVSATGTGGCTFTDTTVHILYAAAAPPIYGDSLICAGVPTTYTDASGGTQWSADPTFGSIDTFGTFIGANIGGINTITYTVPGSGCQAFKTVTVAPFPTPIIGSTIVCTGFKDSLYDVTSHDSGTWSSSNVTIAAISANGVITPHSPGTTTIGYFAVPVYGMSVGCGPTQTVVTVGQTPTLFTPSNHLCVTTSIILTDTLTGGVWSSNNNAIATINSTTGLIHGVSTGLDTISYTMANGCYRAEQFFVTAGPSPISGPPSTCVSFSPMLVDLMPYGTWMSSNTAVATIAASDSVTGTGHAIIPGTTTISYASCGDTVTKLLSVYAQPSPILGTNGVCKGDSIILHDTTVGGIWVSLDTTVAKAAAAFGIITGIRQGSDSIMYILPNGCRTYIAFAVDTLPDTISGINQMCQFASVNLTNVTPSGTWSSLDTTIATVNSSGKVTGLFPGVDSIFYSINIGCKTKFAVTVNPLPTPIAGATILCANGVTDTLRNGYSGGYWISSNTACATIDSFSGVLTTVGKLKDTTFITYVLPTGCQRSILIRELPTPVPHIVWNFLTQEDSCENYFVHYQWYDSSTIGLIPGATTNYLAILYPENYYVRVVDTNGCVGNSALSNPWLSVANTAPTQGINIFPNPTSGKVYISSPLPVGATVLNSVGAIVLHQDKAIQIDLSTLPDGLYHIELFDDKNRKVFTQQVVKE
jgi:Secretion system C-terminal sorting domain